MSSQLHFVLRGDSVLNRCKVATVCLVTYYFVAVRILIQKDRGPKWGALVHQSLFSDFTDPNPVLIKSGQHQLIDNSHLPHIALNQWTQNLYIRSFHSSGWSSRNSVESFVLIWYRMHLCETFSAWLDSEVSIKSTNQCLQSNCENFFSFVLHYAHAGTMMARIQL